jgi:hypothetical protein
VTNQLHELEKVCLTMPARGVSLVPQSAKLGRVKANICESFRLLNLSIDQIWRKPPFRGDMAIPVRRNE